jgi:hypothetical protein
VWWLISAVERLHITWRYLITIWSFMVALKGLSISCCTMRAIWIVNKYLLCFSASHIFRSLPYVHTRALKFINFQNMQRSSRERNTWNTARHLKCCIKCATRNATGRNSVFLSWLVGARINNWTSVWWPNRQGIRDHVDYSKSDYLMRDGPYLI